MFTLRILWCHIVTWADKHSGVLLVVGLIVVLIVVVGSGIKKDIKREIEFVEWCKAEYVEEGHKDIERYCYYLHKGKVTR